MIIDSNAFIGHWPFERLAEADPAGLSRRLRREGIARALVSPINGLFYRSIQDANEALFNDVRCYPRLLPVAVADPTESGWSEYLQRNVEVYGIRAVKLHPNYHGYRMADSSAQHLLALADDLHLPVIIQIQVEEERTQHPRLRVPPADPTEILAALPPDAHTPVILGGLRFYDLMRLAGAIIANPLVHVDIAWLDLMDVLTVVLESIPFKRLLFATHQPLFYPGCALAKVREARLPRRAEDAILSGNARRLFNVQPCDRKNL